MSLRAYAQDSLRSTIDEALNRKIGTLSANRVQTRGAQTAENIHMSEKFETTLAPLIKLLSEDGMMMTMDEDSKASEPATSLQISYFLWKHLMHKFMSNHSDNEIRELAYSQIPEVRRFVADLAVLHVRQKLATPPLEPGHALVVNKKIQDLLGNL